MTDEQQENLNKLADYLDSGELLAKFDMARFDDGWDSTLKRRGLLTNRNTCGTVGCALGHGPYAGITKNYQESWTEYSNRVFGLRNEAWSYCFDDRWDKYDNTPEGAAKRIRTLLAADGVMELPWRNEQRKNLAKLADYLDSGRLLAKFDMGCFEDDCDDDCYYVGSAIGHGPHAGIPKHEGELWLYYSYRVFGLQGDSWEYCFDERWSAYDNTPQGAAKRIRTLLAGDIIELPWYNYI